MYIMATLNWNIKLLGNITSEDFSVWKEVAKIPSCYNFTITESENGWGEHPGFEEASIPIPEDENTIIISGKDAYNLFEPYCFAGHKCVMNTESTNFRTGTQILSLMMASDGLLDRSVIETLSAKIDMDKWMRKYHPEAAPILNAAGKYTDPSGLLDNSDEAVVLENAICKYVLHSLGICKFG